VGDISSLFFPREREATMILTHRRKDDMISPSELSSTVNFPFFAMVLHAPVPSNGQGPPPFVGRVPDEYFPLPPVRQIGVEGSPRSSSS